MRHGIVLLWTALLVSGVAPAALGSSTAADPTVLAAGDIASCAQSGDEATGLLLGQYPLATVAALGDNAYENGTPSEYQSCYGPNWGLALLRTRPAPGNHDYGTANAGGYFGYYGSAAGTAGQGWYSYNLGSWHVVVLNSNCTYIACAPGSPQEQWLRADLAANAGRCTLAYWHHPLFTSGWVGPTSAVTAFWNDLQAVNADLVLNGHAHLYERFARQTVNGVASTNGIREITVGTGGYTEHTFNAISANSEMLNNATFGVLKLTLHPTSYDWQFLPVAGQLFTDSGSTPCHSTSDFSIAVNSSLLSAVQGGSATATVSTAITTGTAQTVKLTASGLPAGVTASFGSTSIASGSTSALTLNVGSSVAPGSYTITVNAAGSGTAQHSSAIALTVSSAAPPPPPPTSRVVNGGFETGSLSGWSPSGAYLPVLSTAPHSGGYSVRVGSTSAVNGNSTLTQTLTLPSGSSTLTFWYQPHCTDSIQYDQIQMQVRSSAGATLWNALNVCSNSGTWTQVTVDLTAWAGQTTVLWFNDHDDGDTSDPTYFLLDDVAVIGSGATTPPPSTNLVQNPGFDTGGFGGWGSTGAYLPVLSTTPHSGAYSARIGSTSAVNGNSTLTQTLTLPSGSSTLTFWYQPHCTDSIQYDQIQMQVRSSSSATLASPLNVCSNSGAWTQVAFDLTPWAGQTIVLWFNDHDDGYAPDPTYFLLDDVSVS